MTATERSDRNPSQRHLNLTTWSNRTGHRFGSTAPPNCALSGSRRLRCAPPLARRQRRALPWETRSAHAGPRIAGTRRPRWLSGQPPGAATSPSSPGSRLSRSRPPRQWRPYRAVARAVLDRQVPAITLRDPALPRTRGCRPGPRVYGLGRSSFLTTLLPARHAPSLR
jgi:hypothetical protein